MGPAEYIYPIDDGSSPPSRLHPDCGLTVAHAFSLAPRSHIFTRNGEISLPFSSSTRKRHMSDVIAAVFNATMVQPRCSRMKLLTGVYAFTCVYNSCPASEVVCSIQSRWNTLCRRLNSSQEAFHTCFEPLELTLNVRSLEMPSLKHSHWLIWPARRTFKSQSQSTSSNLRVISTKKAQASLQFSHLGFSAGRLHIFSLTSERSMYCTVLCLCTDYTVVSHNSQVTSFAQSRTSKLDPET